MVEKTDKVTRILVTLPKGTARQISASKVGISRTKKKILGIPLIAIVAIGLIAAGVGAALILYFQTGPIGSTITIYGAAGRAYGFTSLADYVTPLAEPTDLPQGIGDVREMAVALAVDPDYYLDPATTSYYVAVSATDLPSGATGTFKLAWGVWQDAPISDRILLYSENKVDSLIALAATGEWSAMDNIFFGTTQINVDPADEFSYTFAKADVEDYMIYNVYVVDGAVVPISEAGGIVLQITWDLSGCDVFGDFTPDIVVEFGAVE